jgi:glycosyltransferase involved in cell wall biosynthesis
MATAVRQVEDYETGIEQPRPAPEHKILFLIDEMGGIAEGGTERQILQLVRLAQRLGYAPRMAVLRGTEWLSPEQAGCPIYVAGVRSLFRPSGWRACFDLVRWIRREQITIVQTFFLESNIVGSWLARLAGVPLVIGSRRNLSAWMGPALRQIQRVANVSADYVIANSEGAAESARNVERVPQHKIRIAYNGIDLAQFSALAWKRAAARRMLGIADDQILVGNISCMRRVKGLVSFVDAARIVLESAPDTRFLIVGDGVDSDVIKERIRHHGIGDRIHLAGAQTDVLPYLAAMDIGVLSSLAEGFSNSLLEYMAAGLASVATDVGGNREALQDSGILVSPDDPAALAAGILELRDLPLRRQMGDRARERAKQFSLERAERRMEELYSEMLNAKGIRQPKI